MPVIKENSFFASRVTRILLACFILCLTKNALAVIVPDDYSTIQDALNALRSDALPSGEVIQVRPGIYNEALTYAESPKSFTLRALSGASETIIDASGLGRSAVFIRDITGTVDIEGFTITGGQNPNGSGNLFQRASVNLKDCVIEGNYGYQGGGLQLYDATSTIENSTFRDNVASKAAGGIAIVRGSNVTIVDSAIIDNLTGDVDSIASGGGIQIGNSSVLIRRSIVSGNFAKFCGGGIFAIGEFADPFGITSLTIEDSLISKNQVIHDTGAPVGAGGGVCIEANAIAYITDSIITDNIASGRGGGLNTFQARYEILGTLIEFNQALEKTGGGIHGFSQTPYGSSVLLVDSVIRNNSALNTGGISIGGNGCGTGGVCADLEIQNCLVEKNHAANFGGGISIDETIANIANSHFFQNWTTDETGGLGGGLRIAASSTNIDATTLIGNYAANSGGGIFVGKDTDITIDNSIIYSNYTEQDDKGGGVQVDSLGPPTGTISNTIIVDNSGFQLREQSCLPDLPAPILSYITNSLSNIPVNTLYKSPCNPPGEILDIGDFNSLSPSLKTIDNVDARPAFIDLSVIPLPRGRNVIIWAQAGVDEVDIINLGSFPVNYGSIDVFPACSTNYWLGPEMVTVTGTGAQTLTVSERLFRRSEIIEAEQSIKASASLIGSEANVTFRAKNSISLGQEFAIEAGGTLRLQIDSALCP